MMPAAEKVCFGTDSQAFLVPCRTCGQSFPRSVSFRGGRFADYCSPTCRDVYKFWNAFVRSIDSVRLSDFKRSEWSGRLFLQRNCLGNVKKRGGRS